MRTALALSLLVAASSACRERPTPPPSPPLAAHPRASSRPSVDLRARVDTRALEQYARTQRFSLGRPSRVTITSDGSAALFLRAPAGSSARALFVWERSTRAERLLTTAEALLGGAEGSLSPEERARRERQRVSGRGLASYGLSRDGQRVLIPLSGRLFVLERATGASRELSPGAASPVDARFSPDGRLVALVRGGELAVIDVATGVERRLTSGATPNLTHAVSEFIAQEELGRMEGYWWSPDSASIVYQETDLSRVERLRISDPSHPEREPEESAYPRVGTSNATLRLGVIPVAGGATRWITWDNTAHPYLATVRWSARSPLTLVTLNREQTDASVLTVDPRTGASHEIVHEHDDAWVDVDQTFPLWSADGTGFLWQTEREGKRAIERRSADGSAPVTLSPTTLNVRDLVHFDDAHRTLYLRVGDDTSQSQLARVTLGEDGRTELLTERAGEHDLHVADDGSLQVREEHTLEALPRMTVHGADGAELGVIASGVEAPLATPRVEMKRVGSEGFRVAVVRPQAFRPGGRYPVIVWVYGGPGTRVVTSAMERYITQQWLADQGFIVVLADGRGTPYRGPAWERALKFRVGDVPLDDQVSALRALAATDGSLDLTRVGIIGWSYGGYMAARAVIERPDVFHAAVAGAPVTEWREYDTCYTERYLGLVDAHADAYERASLLPHAPSLLRPLLLVHGTADDNVYFHNSLRLSDALFRAGRRFDFLPLPGQTHMVTDPARVVAWLLRARSFFAEALTGDAPSPISRGADGGVARLSAP